MLSPDFQWTDDRVEKLTEMWTAGTLSASQIANKLGCVSRNAVIGKVARLGLPPRRQVSFSTPKPKKPRVRRAPMPILAKPVCEEIPAEVLTVEPPLHIDLLDLKQHHCRYPYGDGPFTFCGHAVKPDKPYCAAHWAACNTGRPGSGK